MVSTQLKQKLSVVQAGIKSKHNLPALADEVEDILSSVYEEELPSYDEDASFLRMII